MVNTGSRHLNIAPSKMSLPILQKEKRSMYTNPDYCVRQLIDKTCLNDSPSVAAPSPPPPCTPFSVFPQGGGGVRDTGTLLQRCHLQPKNISMLSRMNNVGKNSTVKSVRGTLPHINRKSCQVVTQWGKILNKIKKSSYVSSFMNRYHDITHINHYESLKGTQHISLRWKESHFCCYFHWQLFKLVVHSN